jgi:hypothetical protein
MKTHKNCQVEKAISTDKTRKVLQNVYLKGDALWATDGCCMVRLPIEREEHDVDGFVTAEALKAARKVKSPSGQVSLSLNGVQALPNGQQFPRPTSEQMGQWPNCERIYNLAVEQKTNFKISFDLELLNKVADAMGAEAVCLEFEAPDKPIRVKPSFKKGCAIIAPNAIGIVMPLRTE